MSAKDYSAAKGKAPIAIAETTITKPLRTLSAEETASIAENRRLVLKHCPRIVPMIKDFHEAGLIDGWRSVIEVTFEGGRNGSA